MSDKPGVGKPKESSELELETFKNAVPDKTKLFVDAAIRLGWKPGVKTSDKSRGVYYSIAQNMYNQMAGAGIVKPAFIHATLDMHAGEAKNGPEKIEDISHAKPLNPTSLPPGVGKPGVNKVR